MIIHLLAQSIDEFVDHLLLRTRGLWVRGRGRGGGRHWEKSFLWNDGFFFGVFGFRKSQSLSGEEKWVEGKLYL